MHHIRFLAGLAAKPLVEQIGDIRFVIHDQNTYTHDAASAIVAR
jgi:hypothetical protein